MKTFRDELMDYLERTKEPPYKLAKRAGISMVSLYGYLKGDQDLRLSSVEKLKGAME